MAIPEECPGTKFVKQPVPTEIECPKCGEELEIWSDELYSECPVCCAEVSGSGEEENSCLNWCSYAEKCVGTEKYNKIKGKLQKADEK